MRVRVRVSVRVRVRVRACQPAESRQPGSTTTKQRASAAAWLGLG